MRGSLEGLVSLAYSGHSLTGLVSCFERPAHHTEILTLVQYLTMPWRPSCSFWSTSAWSALGTRILWLYISSPSPFVKSPHASQYNLSDELIWFLLGHPSRQYSSTCWYVGSEDCVFCTRPAADHLQVGEKLLPSCRVLLALADSRFLMRSHHQSGIWTAYWLCTFLYLVHAY